ncbi:MAG: hypothetical protein DCF31_02435 [Alphaproteobacteria bacterium]|nr:MAG: hypothetical protein DCF31_02435 [Alphaproteobacteria bacterium]
MDRAALVRATVIGTILQVAMVVAGHFLPALRDPGFAIGGMALSALAGWLYARTAPRSAWGPALGGGAIAGGVCALIGIGVSVLLGDVPASLLALGTTASAAMGVGGAVLARLLRRQ